MKKFYRVEEDENHQITMYPVEAGWLDGYLVADTLLEDVKFKITVDGKNKLKAEVHPLSVEYFSSFDQKKWLNAILDLAAERDIFDSDPDSEDEYEIVLYDHDLSFDEQIAWFDSEPTFKENEK